MPKVSLTTASVERLRPPANGQVEYYDRRLPGFGLRVSHHGSRSWFLMTRLHGKLIRVTLGRYPALKLGDAREEARRVSHLAEEGKDPRSVKADAKRKEQEARRNTFGACVDEFMKKHVATRLRASTAREYRRILTGPDTRYLHERPIAEVTKRDILDVLEAIDDRGSPGASKRALAYLRKFFNWCAERDIVAAPPTDRVPRPHPEVRRDRVLSEEELRCLLKALDKEDTVFGPLVRVLLLTGQRRAEVGGMRWSELRDLDGDAPCWEIPGARTKNKQGHIVPLSAPVAAILADLPRIGDLVFTTTGETPVSGFGRAKTRLDERVAALRAAEGRPAMPAWTFHDLRRTMVTMMNEQLGIFPHVVEAVVNHMSGLAKVGVAGVYNRALYLGDRRRALDAWGAFVEELRSARDEPTAVSRTDRASADAEPVLNAP